MAIEEPKTRKHFEVETPNRPSFTSASSISSAESTFSELSIFDSDSAGEQTPITPFDTPHSNYFPKTTKKTSDDVRRSLWGKKLQGEIKKHSNSSSASMLAIPNPGSRVRASSAPEKREISDRNEPNDEIDELVLGFRDMDLAKVGLGSPSLKKSTGERHGQQYKHEMTRRMENKTFGSQGVRTTQVQKPSDVGEIRVSKGQAEILTELNARDRSHQLNNSASDHVRAKPKGSKNIHQGSNGETDAPMPTTSGPPDQNGHNAPSTSSVIAAEVIPDSERHRPQKSKKSSSSPPGEVKRISPSLDAAPEAQKSPPARPSSPAPLDTNQANSSTTKTMKSRQKRARAISGSKTNPVTICVDLEPFNEDSMSKNDLKNRVLDVLRHLEWDPTPNPVIGSTVKKTQQKKDYYSKDGYIYIFTSPKYPKYFKIGMTKQRPEDRRNQWKRSCKFECRHLSQPNDKRFCHFGTVEAVVKEELYYERRKFKCGECKSKTQHIFPLEPRKQGQVGEAASDKRTQKYTEHGEWYDISEERALAVVQRWRKWVVVNKPYLKDGSLRDKWIWKIEQAQKSVEMEWMRWIQMQLPKMFHKPDTVERDWDWDRWVQMRWDDWLCYLLYRLDDETRHVWRPVMNLLRHPGLVVWVAVVAALKVVHSVCGGGVWGFFASVWVLGAIIALWLHFGC